MRKFSTIAVLFILLLGLTTGCTHSLDKEVQQETHKKTKKKEEPQLTKVSMEESFNQSISHDAKKRVLAMEEILEARAANSNTDLYVAVKPEHHERFQLKPLKSKIKKKLKKENPTFNVYVSTDQKIFILLDKLENKIKKKEADKEYIKKKLKTVHAEMNSDT
ncbi:YhcN/YlaJ family sporulation lipoprotein [Bacillus sp. Xin]|uniref:YhcN/YlaJ family sporulation lipoprotein n=1 Tax=unclassified Bacillus (in: firmicutes) TaxID=185979 RepID=UPI001571DC14|nr:MULTISPECIES: YhcN/YlaJ family sporulation lipoprotein [unclassified Bacillus (in: firmicutes)]MBC6975234.1 YhcN/YlaJ family sporulation lipoprotein [Bacillus sp. Xin]NSW36760.1 YhcN/YlaJ family sporulation lipoprotein [Bacillus sp. Xin1]